MFVGVEKIIREFFLRRLLFRKTNILYLVAGDPSKMLVKKSGMGILNFSGFSTGEVLNLPAGEHGTGSGRDMRRGIIQCGPPSDFK